MTKEIIKAGIGSSGNVELFKRNVFVKTNKLTFV